MQKNFESSLKRVLVHEGGWTDHPKDPGGPTMKGVTLLTFRRHFGEEKNADDLRNITDKELGKIYRSGYWDKCHCGKLPSGLDYVVFDAAVNSGPARSARWLQAVVGAKPDGGIGPNTLSRVEKYIKAHSTVDVINLTCDSRVSFLKGLSTWSTFGKGWGRRVEGVRSVANIMAGGVSPDIETTPPSDDYETVKKGSIGPWVRKLQQALNILVDGDFGPGTEAALKTWQKKNKLQPDGVAGRNTYRALGLIA